MLCFASQKKRVNGKGRLRPQSLSQLFADESSWGSPPPQEPWTRETGAGRARLLGGEGPGGPHSGFLLSR